MVEVARDVAVVEQLESCAARHLLAVRAPRRRPAVHAIRSRLDIDSVMLREVERTDAARTPHISVAVRLVVAPSIGLPGGLNGRQVADAARLTRPDLKVLFVTGYAENAAVGNGHLDPGMEVITKPFGMAELTNKLAQMFGG